MVTEATREPGIRIRRKASSYILPALATVLVGLLVFWLIVNFVKGPADFMTVFFIGLTNPGAEKASTITLALRS